ncbi:MAG: DUF4832 domain-containing protein [Bacteroidales bacterium]
MKIIILAGGLITLLATGFCQDYRDVEAVLVRPSEIQDVLTNPGIGFTTFQRFNGDNLNTGQGWTEGLPIVYQDFDGNLSNKGYPQTSIAYFRVNWRFLETEPGVYNWDMIDKALRTAAERGQTLMLRISPYEADEEKDVPDWYRRMVGPDTLSGSGKHWRVDPEDPRYIQYFGGMIKALGNRYDGHPDLESVDISIIGYWGEGSGSHLLTDRTRIALINAYLDHFKKTHLIFQPLNGDAPDPGVLVKGLPIAAFWPDGKTNGTGPDMRNLGWRLDCLGDMDFWPEWGWNHMTDVYPQDIVRSGMSEAWKKAPVTLEICGTFQRWLEKQNYTEENVKYIFDQALKWHVSSFNAKSSAVPEKYQPLVEEWLNKMGYRYVLRKFTFPAVVQPHGGLIFTSWWENKGVAPVYRNFRFALRLKNQEKTEVLVTDANLLTWLPGDIVYNDKVFLPHDFPEGAYDLELAIISPTTHEPKVKLAIKGVNEEGWYPMGKILVQMKK